MPNVRTIGSQSATSEGSSAGRIAAAFSPSAVSWMPRRNSHPKIQSDTLAMNGMRQPQLATASALSDRFTSQAEPDPRMNPIVVPAAVELLTSPRIVGDACSVVYTIDPVNSPPSEKP